MRLIIDSDPGMGTIGTDPEDGMAVLYALRSPEVTVEGITLVQGNVPISHAWPNAVHLLSLARRDDVPLHAGAAHPRDVERRRIQTAWLLQRGGMDRLAPTLVPPPATAAEFLRDTIRAAPGAITVVAIGPLTNIAAAIEADPAVAADMAGLVVMGGTVAVAGNITPAAEFNIWMDPEAADIVFRSGAPVTMVGLDVCHRTRFGRADAERLKGSGDPLSAFVSDAALSWIDVRAQLFGDDEAMHLYDTLAMAAAIEPGLLTYDRALVQIETSTGPAQGMTVCHRNPALRQLLTGKEPNADVGVDVDVEHFMDRFVARVGGTS